MTRALVLPSPLLPGVAYEPLVAGMTARGWDSSLAEAPPSPAGPEPVLDAFAEAVARARPDLVLAHSNAGRYAPTVAGGIPLVFVDAALPPEQGSAPLAPEALLDHLAGLAGDDGTLPPWTRWWPDDAVRDVLPDADILARIRAGERRMPLAYFRAGLAAPHGWAGGRCAYLAFGETYAAEVALARGHGWPVTVLDGTRHLHHTVDPAGVAAEVATLAARLGVPGPA